MTRIRAILAIAALVSALVPASPAAAETTDVELTITGSGWGHGVGMSQYGARAMAESGRTAEEIVNYYYAGITVKDLDTIELFPEHQWMRGDDDPLWVGLAQNRSTLRFHVHGPDGSEAGLCKAGDGEGACPTQFARPGEAWEFRALGGGACQFFRDGTPVGNPGLCRAAVSWDPQPDVSVHLDDLGREYARGELKLRPVGSNFHVSLEIGVEDYVKGIGEVPSDWHPEALKAQAIAARTYGLRQMLYYGEVERENPDGTTSIVLDPARQQQCWCQIYSSVVDQNYVGYQKETELWGDRWVAAVDATAGRVITHPQAGASSIIVAYYSSSSGGHTDSNIEGLGHFQPIPYLPGVDDPWSVDPLAQNPFASWTVTTTYSRIAELYSLDSVTNVQITERNGSGSVARVVITGMLDGAEVTRIRTGRSFKATLGLRSHTFDFDGTAVAESTPGLCATDMPDAGFPDVDSETVDPGHIENIDCMASHGIMPGVDGLFRPDVPVVRWEMAEYMIRHAAVLGEEIPVGTDQGFSDIGELPEEVQLAINRLAEMGLTKGVGDNRYDPYRAVPRQQMAIFLTRLHTEYGFELPGGRDHGFVDLEGQSGEAILAINQLAELGITQGTSATTYEPNREVTQAQMASFLARLLRLDS